MRHPSPRLALWHIALHLLLCVALASALPPPDPLSLHLTLRLYAGESLQGEQLQLSCSSTDECTGEQTYALPVTFHPRSLDVDAGLEVGLFADAACAGASHSLWSRSLSLPSISEGASVHCVRMRRLSPSEGVIVFAGEQWNGAAQWLKPGVHTGADLHLAGAIRSLWVGVQQGCSVTLLTGSLQNPGESMQVGKSLPSLGSLNSRVQTVLVNFWMANPPLLQSHLEQQRQQEEQRRRQQEEEERKRVRAQEEEAAREAARQRAVAEAEERYRQSMLAMQQAEAERVHREAVERALQAAEAQRLAHAAADQNDPHLAGARAWRQEQGSAFNPFLAPMHVTLCAESGFLGSSLRLSCCDVETNLTARMVTTSGQHWSAASLRVSAGARVHLYADETCLGASINFDSNVRTLASSPAAHMVGRIACLRLERLSDTAGVVLYPEADFGGEGELLAVGSYDTPSLYRDNSVRSVWMRHMSFRITLRDSDFSQPGSAQLSLTSSLPDLVPYNFADRTSSAIVEFFCHPPCQNNGYCSGIETCTCPLGWSGRYCEMPLPDTSSFVVCDQREYFVGESMRCTLHPRRDGQAMVTTRQAFMITPLLSLAISAESGGEGIQWAQPESQHHAPSFEFTLMARHATVGDKSQSLLQAHVNQAFKFPSPGVASTTNPYLASGAVLTPLTQLPLVRVFEHPDGSSTLSCSKRRTLVNERIACTILPRRNGQPLTTLTRAFVLAADPQLARLSKLVAIDPDRESKRLKNERVGSKMRFFYTALRLGAPSQIRAGQAARGSKNQLSVHCGWSSSAQAGAQSAGIDAQCFAPLQLTIHHAPPAEEDFFAQAKQLVFQQQFWAALPLLTRAHRTQLSQRKEILLLRSDLYLLFGRLAHAKDDLNTLARLAQGEWVEIVRGQHNDSNINADVPPAAPLKKDRALLRRVQQKRGVLLRAESEQSRGMLAHAMSDWALAVSHLSTALEIARYSERLHLLRADCALRLGEYNLLKYDVVSVLNQRPHDAQAILLLAKGYYQILGKIDGAIANLRHCLHSASQQQHNGTQSESECERTYRLYTSLADARAIVEEKARAGQWEEAALQCERVRDLDRSSGPASRELLYQQCGFYTRANATHTYAKSVNVCSEAIRMLSGEMKAAERAGLGESSTDRARLFELHLDRAFSFFYLRKLEAAVSDLKVCIGMQLGSSPRLEELQSLLNAAKAAKPKRDLYELLGVERNATKVELKRAYRKLALQYHPDKNDSPEAAEMFLDVTEAFAVLYDDDLRAKYDAGMGTAQMRKEEQERAQRRAPFEFHFGEMTEEGRVKAWFTNAEGEQEWTEFETHESAARRAAEEEQKQREREAEKRKEMPKHCCLPPGQGE